MNSTGLTIRTIRQTFIFAFSCIVIFGAVNCSSVSSYNLSGGRYSLKAKEFISKRKNKSKRDSLSINLSITHSLKDSVIHYYTLALDEFRKSGNLVGQLECLININEELPMTRRCTDEQAKLLDSLLERTEQVSGKKHALLLIEGYEQLNLVYYNRRDYLKQIKAADKLYSLKCKKGLVTPSDQSHYCFYLARAYSGMEMYDSSNAWCKRMLNIQGRGMTSMKSKPYQILADNYEAMGYPDSAIAFLRLSAAAKSGNEDFSELPGMDDLHRIAIIYKNQGNYRKALEVYREIENYHKKNNLDNVETLQPIYRSMGNILKLMGDYTSAIDYYKRAIEIQQHSRVFKYFSDSLSFARLYMFLSQCYFQLGDNDLALKFSQKSISLASANYKSVDQLGPFYNHLGTVYGRIGKLDEALSFVDTAEVLINKYYEKNSMNSDLNYYTRGNIYMDNRKYDQAIEAYKSIFKNPVTVTRRSYSLVEVNNKLSRAYFEKGDYFNSLKYAQNAITGNTAGFSDTSYFKNPPVESILTETQIILSLKLKVKCFSELYKSSRNADYLKYLYESSSLIITLLDQVRNQYLSEASKLFLVEQSFDIFETGISSAVALYNLTGNEEYLLKAFRLCEKSKTKSLYESISENNARLKAEIPDSLLKYDLELKQEQSDLKIRLALEMERSGQNNSAIDSLQSGLFRIRKDQRLFTESLEKDYPDYYHLKYQTNYSDIDDLQKKLGNSAALIEYFAGRNSLFIFACTNNKYRVIPVPVDSNFFHTVEDFSRLLQKKTSLIKHEYRHEFIKKGSYLYSQLIEPVKEIISSKKELVIIPDDVLYTIPFEALPVDGKDNEYSKVNYLIRSFDISYHYSSSIKYNSPYTYVDRSREGFVGFAPVFGDSIHTDLVLRNTKPVNSVFHKMSGSGKFAENNDSRYYYSAIGDYAKRKLPYSEDEVKKIVNLFDKTGKKAEAFLYKSAAEDRFKSELSKGSYRFLHIATHGFADESNPALSGLVFSVPDSSSKEDGVLHAEEMFNLKVNADIAVLSSCESGIGKLYKGEGMLAITRGFLHAGVSNLLFSLWKVSDKQTCALMVEFYHNVLKGKTYQNSLRNAKLKMLEDKNSAIPYYWSSFVLVGR